MKLRAQGVEWREVEDEIVVLDMDGSRYLAVNGSGTVLWKALVSGASTDELADTLIETYGIAREDAVRDTEAFVRMLHDRDLLEA